MQTEGGGGKICKIQGGSFFVCVCMCGEETVLQFSI